MNKKVITERKLRKNNHKINTPLIIFSSVNISILYFKKTRIIFSLLLNNFFTFIFRYGQNPKKVKYYSDYIFFL
jgi:hypothetical protein